MLRSTKAPSGRWWIALASTFFALPAFAQADAPKPESPLIRLLKGSAKSAERQARIIDQIGKRGKPDDLGFLYRESLKPDGFPAENRVKALDALAEAAATRKEKPPGDLGSLGALIGPGGDVAARLAAARLAGIWGVEALIPLLGEVASKPESAGPLRASAIESIAAIGGEGGKKAIEGLITDKSPAVRSLAIAASVRFDEKEAANRAADALRDATDPPVVEPLIAAFLDRQGGAEVLASAIASKGLSADPAKLALRSVYALGRSDAGLVAELTKAAGMEAEPKPPTASEMERFLSEVASKGDPARGESIFRRADLNCTKCHALAGAGGGVGPDLSPVGSSSPVDYLINSILVPDQAIKEVYQTQVVLTTDGRVYQGIVADKDASKVVLRDASGELRTIPASEIEETKEGGSLMPKGLANFLTRAEFVDLVRFLSELGKPGPYAIRTSPTIQRWRVVESSAARPGDLPKPDSEAWAPAYGMVSGALPLKELAKSGKPLILRGDVDVSVEGALTFRLGSAEGVTAWIDDGPAEIKDSAINATLAPGRHSLTLRVDPAKVSDGWLRVEVVKSEGSRAEFAIVGGR